MAAQLQAQREKAYADWLQAQIRFRHLFRPGQEGLLADLQAEADRDWAVLGAKCGGNIGPARTPWIKLAEKSSHETRELLEDRL